MKDKILTSMKYSVKSVRLNLITPPDLIIKLKHIKFPILDYFDLQKYNFIWFNPTCKEGADKQVKVNPMVKHSQNLNCTNHPQFLQQQ